MTPHPISKRALLGGLVCLAVARPARAALPPIAMAEHERCMRLAIAEARRNPVNSSVTQAAARVSLKAFISALPWPCCRRGYRRAR